MKKLKKIIKQGLDNCNSLGIQNFHSYAGYASVFVKNKKEYLEHSIFPTPKVINEQFNYLIPKDVKVLNFYPGEIFNFKSIQKSFFSENYNDENLQKVSHNYYEIYGTIKKCDTYNSDIVINNNNSKVLYFLEKFDEFVKSKLINGGAQSYKTIISKTIKLKDIDLNKEWVLEFGKGVINNSIRPNKTIILNSKILSKLVNGEILFENLYTGYEAEFERYPKDIYNRDIIMFMVMFSYVYKNRIVKSEEFKSLD